jgi:tetratricopeptide (TPR) repeat protein
MYDIFVSYASPDRPRAEALVWELKRQGWKVWWDRDSLPAGVQFREAIELALADARLILVLWSHHSIKSHYVVGEAEFGLQRNILLPVLLDDVRIPLGFAGIHACDIRTWHEDNRDRSTLESLLKALREALGRPPGERKPIAGLELTEDLPFTQLWKTAISTNHFSNQFSRSLQETLASVSRDTKSWNPLIYISYRWLLDELAITRRISPNSWKMLCKIIENDKISVQLRRDTLTKLPTYLEELANPAGATPPMIFSRSRHWDLQRNLFEDIFTPENVVHKNSSIADSGRTLCFLWTLGDTRNRRRIVHAIERFFAEQGLSLEEGGKKELDALRRATPPDLSASLARLREAHDKYMRPLRMTPHPREGGITTYQESSELLRTLHDTLLQASIQEEEGDDEAYGKVRGVVLSRSSIDWLKAEHGDELTYRLLAKVTLDPLMEVGLASLALGFLIERFGEAGLRLIDQHDLDGLLVNKKRGRFRGSVVDALCGSTMVEDDAYSANIIIKLHAILSCRQKRLLLQSVQHASKGSRRLVRVVQFLTGKISRDELDKEMANAEMQEDTSGSSLALRDATETYALAVAALHRGHVEQAKNHLLEILEQEWTSAAGDDKQVKADARYQLGMLEMRLGNISTAQRLFDEQLAQTDSSAEDYFTAQARFQLGQIAARRGNIDEAVQSYQEAAGLLEKQERFEALGMTLRQVGRLLSSKARYEEAAHWIVKALMAYCREDAAIEEFLHAVQDFKKVYLAASASQKQRIKDEWNENDLGPCPIFE